MVNKRFDRTLFNLYDAQAKAQAILFLLETGRATSAWLNPERYGVDVLGVTGGGKSIELEAEVKVVWPGGEFPYEDIQVLGRKEKYFTTGAGLILFAANLDHYLFIPAKHILASPKVKVSNRYVREGEYFFKVPLAKAIFGQLKKELKPCTACKSVDIALVSTKEVGKLTAECMSCGKQRQRYFQKKHN